MTETRLYVLCLGFIENDVALNYNLANQATVDEPNRRAEWHRVPSLAVLIQHHSLGWILVDSGSHPDAMEGYWPAEATAELKLVRNREHMLDVQLSNLGLSPKDIDWLVQTHLHLDHAGNIFQFSGTKAGQRIVVQESELKQALFETSTGDGTTRSGYHRPDFLDIPDTRYEIVNGDVDLSEDVKLVCLPGHSAGLMGVIVHLKDDGTVIFTSDAINWNKNLGPPMHISGVFHDTVAMVESMRKASWLQRRYNATMIFGHDLRQLETLKLAPDSYYS